MHNRLSQAHIIRCLKPIDDLKVGDRILMWVEEGQIHGQAGERGLYYDETEFREHFAPLPEGRKLQLERINGLLAEASNEETAASAVPQLPFETGGASLRRLSPPNIAPASLKQSSPPSWPKSVLRLSRRKCRVC